MDFQLKPHATPGATVQAVSGGATRLQIPAGPEKEYRLAQLDDTHGLHRRSFRRHPPLVFSLEARASAVNLPGTWGFGLWNVPLSFSIGFGSSALLPALPEAAWFFHASPQSFLTFRDDQPGSGFLAQYFRSAGVPTWALLPTAPLFPLLALPPVSRLVRRIVSRRLVRDEGIALAHNSVTDWHRYEIRWNESSVTFLVDGETALQTALSPHPPLGIVLWVDNQFAAWTPEGRLRYGLEKNPAPAWIEIRGVDTRPG